MAAAAPTLRVAETGGIGRDSAGGKGEWPRWWGGERIAVARRFALPLALFAQLFKVNIAVTNSKKHASEIRRQGERMAVARRRLRAAGGESESPRRGNSLSPPERMAVGASGCGAVEGRANGRERRGWGRVAATRRGVRANRRGEAIRSLPQSEWLWGRVAATGRGGKQMATSGKGGGRVAATRRGERANRRDEAIRSLPPCRLLGREQRGRAGCCWCCCPFLHSFLK